jgi:hypothetical protein
MSSKDTPLANAASVSSSAAARSTSGGHGVLGRTISDSVTGQRTSAATARAASPD